MQAPQSVPSRRSRPPIALARTRTTPQDGATTLALTLAAVRFGFRLDVIVLSDVDGRILASAGDACAASELAPFAASAARTSRARRAEILPRLGVIVETLEHGGRTWVLAATATDPARDVRGIVAAIRESLPSIAAAVARDEDDDHDDFEAALDAAFAPDRDDDDPFADLAATIG